MGIIDSIQNIIDGAGDLAQGPISDALGGITDNPIVQDLQDQATTVTDGATDVITSVTDQGQTVV